MKILKNNMFWVGMLFSLLLLSGCSTQHKADDELVLGTCAGFPPYEVLNDHGEIVGFDIDVAKKIAAKLGKKLVIKDMSLDALMVALKQGKIDIIIAGLSITKARLAEIAMVHHHGKPITHLPILFWQKIPTGVKSIADMKSLPNKTVCVQVGTIQEEIASTYSYLTIKHLENIPDLIMDIKYGKSIAAILEPMVVTELQKQMPQIKTLDLPLKEDEQTMGHGIGINKENTALITTIEQVVAQLKADGSLNALEAQWFPKDHHDGK
jgi:arginine transport system substrate-binding protein